MNKSKKLTTCIDFNRQLKRFLQLVMMSHVIGIRKASEIQLDNKIYITYIKIQIYNTSYDSTFQLSLAVRLVNATWERRAHYVQ